MEAAKKKGKGEKGKEKREGEKNGFIKLLLFCSGFSRTQKEGEREEKKGEKKKKEKTSCFHLHYALKHQAAQPRARVPQGKKGRYRTSR